MKLDPRAVAPPLLAAHIGYRESQSGERQGAPEYRLDEDFSHESVLMARKSLRHSVKLREEVATSSVLSPKLARRQRKHNRGIAADNMPAELDAMLLNEWVRCQHWRSACETGDLASITIQIPEPSIEGIFASSSSWYAPHQVHRHPPAWRGGGDRLDIVATDGS